MGFGGAESVRGDARWHGVCLALAELARRGIVREEVLEETVTWVLKVSQLSWMSGADNRLFRLICDGRPIRSEPMFETLLPTCCGPCLELARLQCSNPLQPILLQLSYGRPVSTGRLESVGQPVRLSKRVSADW